MSSAFSGAPQGFIFPEQNPEKKKISNFSYILGLFLGVDLCTSHGVQAIPFGNSSQLPAWGFKFFLSLPKARVFIIPDRLLSNLFLTGASQVSWKIYFNASPCLIFCMLKWLSNLSLQVVFAQTIILAALLWIFPMVPIFLGIQHSKWVHYSDGSLTNHK